MWRVFVQFENKFKIDLYFQDLTTIHVSNEMEKKKAENVQKDSSNLQDNRNVDLYVEFYGEKGSSYIYVYCV